MYIVFILSKQIKPSLRSANVCAHAQTNAKTNAFSDAQAYTIPHSTGSTFVFSFFYYFYYFAFPAATTVV